MANGTVDFFVDTGGYGFISTEDEDDDVFVHMADVGGPGLEEGQDVDFDVEQAPMSPRATTVVRNWRRSLRSPDGDRKSSEFVRRTTRERRHWYPRSGATERPAVPDQNPFQRLDGLTGYERRGDGGEH